MQPLRCPTCRGFDWYRDGFSVSEDEEGRLRSERVELASADAPKFWSCTLCGHELPNWSALARSLDALRSVRMTEIGPAERESGESGLGEPGLMQPGFDDPAPVEPAYGGPSSEERT